MAARMREWALLDAGAARRDVPGNVLVVGHSFGGQALGLLPEAERIRGALLVGAQSGYWRNWPPLGRLWMGPTTHVGPDPVPRPFGHFPGPRPGFGEDLPPRVGDE